MGVCKHEVLLLIQRRGPVRGRDLASLSTYSPDTARSYLSQLSRQGLLRRSAEGYRLSEKGSQRLAFFDALGCDYPYCNLCQEKPTNIVCPSCRHAFLKTEATFVPGWENLFFKQASGVRCPRCKQFTPVKGQRAGLTPSRGSQGQSALTELIEGLSGGQE